MCVNVCVCLCVWRAMMTNEKSSQPNRFLSSSMQLCLIICFCCCCFLCSFRIIFSLYYIVVRMHAHRSAHQIVSKSGPKWIWRKFNKRIELANDRRLLIEANNMHACTIIRYFRLPYQYKWAPHFSRCRPAISCMRRYTFVFFLSLLIPMKNITLWFGIFFASN